MSSSSSRAISQRMRSGPSSSHRTWCHHCHASTHPIVLLFFVFSRALGHILSCPRSAFWITASLIVRLIPGLLCLRISFVLYIYIHITVRHSLPSFTPFSNQVKLHPGARLEVELVDLVHGIADTEPMPMLRPWLYSRPLLLWFCAMYVWQVRYRASGVRTATRSILPTATCRSMQRMERRMWYHGLQHWLVARGSGPVAVRAKHP